MSTTPTFNPSSYKETTRLQWQQAAEAWHRWTPTIANWLGPATEQMLDLAGIGPGMRVLDVAAGAGEQTLAVAKRVGPSGYVLATDISSEILTYAQQACHAAGLNHVETRVMDGENLDVEPSSFDAVISRVGLIYFPNRQQALAGMYRVLKPGGRIAAMVYTTAEHNKFFSVPVSLIRQKAQLPPPAPGQPGPFSLADSSVLTSAYQEVGFKDVKTETVDAPLRLPSAAECVRFERESFGALHQMLTGVPETEQQLVWKEIEEALTAFERGGEFVGPCEMLIAIGTKDSASSMS